MLPVAAQSLPATASTRTVPPNDPALDGGDAVGFDAVLADTPADSAQPEDAQPALPVASRAPAQSAQTEENAPPSSDVVTEAVEMADSDVFLDATDVRAPVLSAAGAAESPRIDDRDDDRDDCPVPSPALASAVLLPASGSCSTGDGPLGIEIQAAEARPAAEIRSGSGTPPLTGAPPVKADRIEADITQEDRALLKDQGQSTPSAATPNRVEQTSTVATLAATHPAMRDGGRNGAADATDTADVAVEPGDVAGIAFGSLVANPSSAAFPVGADGMATNRPSMAVAAPVVAATPGSLGPEIARIIQSKAGDEVEIQLAPHELGRLRIRVAVESEATRVTVQAERPETLDLMRRNGEVLMKELRAAGFAGGTLDFAGWSGGSQRSHSFAAPGQFPVGENVSIAEVRVLSPDPTHRTGTGLNLRL